MWSEGKEEVSFTKRKSNDVDLASPSPPPFLPNGHVLFHSQTNYGLQSWEGSPCWWLSRLGSCSSRLRRLDFLSVLHLHRLDLLKSSSPFTFQPLRLLRYHHHSSLTSVHRCRVEVSRRLRDWEGYGGGGWERREEQVRSDRCREDAEGRRGTRGEGQGSSRDQGRLGCSHPGRQRLLFAKETGQ